MVPSYTTGEDGAFFDLADLADHPSAPSLGKKRLYALAGGVYVKDALGTTTQLGAAQGGSELPVGTIYHAYVATDPSVLLGYGTWARIGIGRVLVGQNPGDADFLTAGLTGGAKTKTLGVNEMPAHTHVITSQTATTGGATSYEHGTLDTSSAEAEATEVTGSTGGGAAFSLMNPYEVVYIWRRTA